MILSKKQLKWVKEGRGLGSGSGYKPWITVRDFGSSGRCHRVFSSKTNRIHHLFSDLELAVFHLIEWDSSVLDIREQFPLDYKITLDISSKASIKHPRCGKYLQIMSSDFLIDSNDKTSPSFALQAKYSKDLQDQRTLEKLEMERLYWKAKNVPWSIITENEIEPVVFNNIQWLYPSIMSETIPSDILSEKIAFYAHCFECYPATRIIELSKYLDKKYNLPIGSSLAEIKCLLARRFFSFDFKIKHTKLLIRDLSLSVLYDVKRCLYASN